MEVRETVGTEGKSAIPNTKKQPFYVILLTNNGWYFQYLEIINVFAYRFRMFWFALFCQMNFVRVIDQSPIGVFTDIIERKSVTV